MMSRPAQGRDATLFFGMKGLVFLPFFPLSPGRAIACVIGPSLQKRKVWAVHLVFVRSLSFEFSLWLFCFLPRLTFGISSSRGSVWGNSLRKVWFFGSVDI